MEKEIQCIENQIGIPKTLIGVLFETFRKKCNIKAGVAGDNRISTFLERFLEGELRGKNETFLKFCYPPIKEPYNYIPSLSESMCVKIRTGSQLPTYKTLDFFCYVAWGKSLAYSLLCREFISKESKFCIDFENYGKEEFERLKTFIDENRIELSINDEVPRGLSKENAPERQIPLAQQKNNANSIPASTPLISLARPPYINHPYAIVKNFTGRREELQQLTEWLNYQTEPMCILEAIGGMGKSSLSWKWLHDEIISKNIQFDGIVWWSCYDQIFEDFIDHLYEYCIPEAQRNKQRQIDKTTEVVAALSNHKFLLIFDGFERILKGYAYMTAMYFEEDSISNDREKDTITETFDVRQRTPITPKAEKLLKSLCAGKSKTLITTRLNPATVEGLGGIKHIQLTGLSKTDTIAFLKLEGISGTESDMVRAGAVYNNHPLMLKLLSSALKRSFTKDIKKAFTDSYFTEKIINEKEPKKILDTSFRLLNKYEQKVALTISVFRTTFNFNAARALFTFDPKKELFPKMNSKKLEAILIELCNLGFILHNEHSQLFDFHPIMRSYLYNTLTGKDNVHQLAADYFNRIPQKDKVISLTDLEPVIELFHHLIRGNNFAQAYSLYISRLSTPLQIQLSQNRICVELLIQLLGTKNILPNQISKTTQGHFFNNLAFCYLKLGEMDNAIECYLKSILIYYEEKKIENLSVVLHNLSRIYLFSCKFCIAIIYTRKATSLLKDNNFDLGGDDYSIFGELLCAQAHFRELPMDDNSAESYLKKEINYYTQNGEIGALSITALEYTILILRQLDVSYKKDFTLLDEAMNWSLRAIEFAEHQRQAIYPIPGQILGGYEAISRTLIAILQYKRAIKVENGKVFFYEEHFENIRDKINIDDTNYFILAERCIHEGLMISRKINRSYYECIFLFLLVRIKWLKIRGNEIGKIHFIELENCIEDARRLAIEINYAMLLTDIHLFCESTLIEMNEGGYGPNERLLGLNVKEHAVKAKAYAKDTSALEDLFLPPNEDEFYKDIPEYTIVKRGLTDDEQRDCGYYLGWLRSVRMLQEISSE